MEPISDRAREALADHRARTGFGPGRKDAVRERLEASIAAGAASDFVAELDQAAAEEGKGASPATAAGRGARIGGMLALALAAGLVGVWWMSAEAVGEQATVRAPAAAYEGEPSAVAERATTRKDTTPLAEAEPSAAEPVVEDEVADDDARDSKSSTASEPAPKRPRPRKAPHQEPTPAAESTLAAELRLLRQARGSLARGDRKGALSTLERHAEQFPGGQLEPERAALRVEVLCELDPDRGERARRSFLARYGGSGHAKRVRALTCRSSD